MNKLWNVEKFIGSIVKEKPNEVKLHLIDKWILSLYSKLVKRVTEYMERFEYSNAMKEIEYFLWHEFADHYIEMVKHRVYEKKDDSALYTLYTIGLGIAKLFAPFLPFIAEEIYHNFYRKFEEDESIHVSKWPSPLLVDEKAEKEGEKVKIVIARIREWKSKQGMPLNAPIEKVTIYGNVDALDIIAGTLKIKNIEISEEKPAVKKIAKPVFSKIGPAFKEKSKIVIEEINRNAEEIAEKIATKGYYLVKINGEEVKLDESMVEIIEEPPENLIKANDIFILIE